MFNSIQFNFIIEARNNQFQALTDKTIEGRREEKKTNTNQRSVHRERARKRDQAAS